MGYGLAEFANADNLVKHAWQPPVVEVNATVDLCLAEFANAHNLVKHACQPPVVDSNATVDLYWALGVGGGHADRRGRAVVRPRGQRPARRAVGTH